MSCYGQFRAGLKWKKKLKTTAPTPIHTAQEITQASIGHPSDGAQSSLDNPGVTDILTGTLRLGRGLCGGDRQAEGTKETLPPFILDVPVPALKLSGRDKE